MGNATINLLGYSVIEQIYSGTRTLVYRGIRETDRQPVVIKVLRNEFPPFNELVHFRNQYIIGKNLDLPGIIKTYSLERYYNSFALILEDFGGISLCSYLTSVAETSNQASKTSGLPISLFFSIAIQVAHTLDALCRHRVIHKDLKPANIVINPISKEVKLIDFSIASLLPRETQEIQNPNILEGTLPYISPEQTGRMNRGIDYRTDFYSLGVTFYELLTGQLPFQTDDPMDLVHCHLAKQAIPVHHLNENVPPVLSEIVSKLMAKNAEHRYQSALGLEYDLQSCLSQWKDAGETANFDLATRDLCDRFIIPEKLYGRENEVLALLAAFERVSAGSAEMMLVAGFSGIGKTAVVNEVHKPIVRQRGYFIKGKFDQFQRNLPFSAFVQAFRDLMAQLLSETDAKVEQWKTQILTALGENAQVIVDVIPELERIIGEQTPAPELTGTAAQNRFNRLFENFISVFTTQEHPLVIFLDDLQWVDLASLNLIQLRTSDHERRYLFLMGAYRDNEVSPVHPLMLTLSDIQKAGATVNTITLEPLGVSDLNSLIADTLACSTALALPLTDLVYQKTKGNPFFSTQFLKFLYKDGLIAFNFEARYWQCDIVQVRTLALTDDVVEFMALQLRKLPDPTQEILKLAACIGNQFDLATLGIVNEKSPIGTANILWKALQEGLIIPVSEVYKFYQGEENGELAIGQKKSDPLPTYKFLHDRVQQAAYSLIPENEKQATHLKIGQLLLHNSSEIQREEKLFDIVGHLNLGQELITLSSDREALAQLNIKAGGKARDSTAYAAGMLYLQTGIDLLTANCWQSQYELTLNLYVAAAEAAYLNGDFDSMEQIAALVLQKAQTILDKVKIYEIQIAAQTAQSKTLEAIAIARDALGQLGVEFPTAPDEAKIGKALQDLATQLQDRQIEEMANLPLMSDPQIQAAMPLLGMLFAPILQGIPGLVPILSSTMVSLSLEFGNAPASTVGYAIHGMVLCAFLGEVETGYSFGKLALNLLAQFNTREFKCITHNMFGAFIQHHQDAMRAGIPTLKEGYLAGMETGDFLNAGYNIATYSYINFFGGVELDTWEPELAGYSAALAKVKQYSAQTYLHMEQQMLKNLREVVSQPDCLMGTAYDERVMIPKHYQDHEFSAIALVYIYKQVLAYSFGNYPAALDYTNQAKQYSMAVSGLILVSIFHFYAALTHLALFPTQPEQAQAGILAQVETHQSILYQAAQKAPMNHLHKWYLVEAERQRVLGHKANALEMYDLAISGAKNNEYVNEEALANELAAKFYLEWGKEKIAQVYLVDAYYGYARWGAKAKVDDLEDRYPQLLVSILQQNRTDPFEAGTISKGTFSISSTHQTLAGSTSTTVIDLPTVIKASQVLSSEIQIDQLLTTLMQVVVKNAGAQTGVLILNEEGGWKIAVHCLNRQGCFLQDILIEQSQEIPQTLINYVKRTQKPLVFDDAGTHLTFASDPYMKQHQPKSILCTPILHQGKMMAILYLENNLATGAFTGDRVAILNILCSQAAISLQNARLYQQSQEYAQKLELYLNNLKQMQLQLVQSEKMSALGNLVAGVAHEINNPVGFLLGNLQPAQDYLRDLFNLLDLYQDKFANPGAEIEAEIEAIDLEYLREDLPKLINSMNEGVDRIRNISTSLRTFSRADSDRPVPFNIHEGIDSTLLILKHRLKASERRPAIEIVKEYGNLPLVECFPGQLNQVFMNILANAIDALEDSNKGRSFKEIQNFPNLITIQTAQDKESERVLIRIKDNGAGMSDEVQEKIFDHLFTTKPVGEGTGLGLSIARQIVLEKHRGTLEVNSSIGQGSELIISIPLKG
ncbi:ATP-binding sensor histidine kinase [Microcoleus sp. FACHB-672]|uniref:trifunctional serine/threonine-protein kinase/ATP-binding protein/sensor histidine kinase n=1 Tax=Microcoleus sp. FACHB-672 TaxID=2692825 RepID=UPI0016855FCE|nr:ATP-binding sensor histidine kinase [Microcoleus sp. FACHB-672]MBD2042341.1 AAA family ATPase [Microcoleus sp. FACHB-672]